MKDNFKIKKEYSDEKKLLYNERLLNKKKPKKIIKSINFLNNSGSIINREFEKNDIISNKNKENDNKISKKIRNPGIDFARIISMFNIVLNHYIRNGFVFDHFPQYERQLSLLKSFTDWNNNAFILISGIVGYKTNKYSNLIYLWLTVFFYSVGIHKFYEYFKKNSIIKENIIYEYYPMIFKRYWFFTTYFGMYLFLPII